jgi:hypothetical protein
MRSMAAESTHGPGALTPQGPPDLGVEAYGPGMTGSDLTRLAAEQRGLEVLLPCSRAMAA